MAKAADENSGEFQRGWNVAIRAAREWHKGRATRRWFNRGARGSRKPWSARRRFIGIQPK